MKVGIEPIPFHTLQCQLSPKIPSIDPGKRYTEPSQLLAHGRIARLITSYRWWGILQGDRSLRSIIGHGAVRKSKNIINLRPGDPSPLIGNFQGDVLRPLHHDDGDGRQTRLVGHHRTGRPHLRRQHRQRLLVLTPMRPGVRRRRGKMPPYGRHAGVLQQLLQHVPQMVRDVGERPPAPLLGPAESSPSPSSPGLGVHDVDGGGDSVDLPDLGADVGGYPAGLGEGVAVPTDAAGFGVAGAEVFVIVRVVGQKSAGPLGPARGGEDVVFGEEAEAHPGGEETVEGVVRVVHEGVGAPTFVAEAAEAPGDGAGDGGAVENQSFQHLREFLLFLRRGRDGDVVEPTDVVDVDVHRGADAGDVAQSAGEVAEVHGALGDADGELPPEKLGVDEAARGGVVHGRVAVHLAEGERGGFALGEEQDVFPFRITVFFSCSPGRGRGRGGRQGVVEGGHGDRLHVLLQLRPRMDLLGLLGARITRRTEAGNEARFDFFLAGPRRTGQRGGETACDATFTADGADEADGGGGGTAAADHFRNMVRDDVKVVRDVVLWQ
mmetsp:Transcript_14921/g.33162  ORF Transcript_14921/g.33162 Transcript_14921/m.33162 type:complete len:549 (+) Transcript_14921:641-2287(+)